MDGIHIDSQAIDGALEGVSLSLSSINMTLNNEYVWILAVMFVGFSLGVMIMSWLLLGHRSDNDSLASLSGGSENGVSDAYWASKYLKSGGNIDNAANQEFIRAWAKTQK